MSAETAASGEDSASAAVEMPPWAERLVPALAGNAARVYEPAFEWLRRAGRLPAGDLASAAVLIALLDRDAEPAVLFTRRHDTLVQHAGQVAFPGGGAEPADRGPEETALREASEEVGLSPERAHVLGRLPRYPTTSAYLVTPVVGYVKGAHEFVMQKQEVADIFSVPFAILLDESRWQERPIGLGGHSLLLPELTWEDRRIWGATAGMLRLLLPSLREAWQR